MNLPFSHEGFLDVFGEYNRALWPAVTALWVVTAGMALRWMLKSRMNGSILFTLLAIHWAWSGVVYHWFFFRSINPGAAVFGAAFVLQAVLFLWLALKGQVRAALDRSPRSVLGAAFVAYGLAYPLMGFGLGLEYPRMPLFAVPCPTTLLSAGLLLTASGAPRFVNVVPFLWAAIGGSAALVLGIRADLGLIPAGLLLALDTFAPSVLGPKAAA